ncbi:MAG TPA: hypothetical protein DCR97_07725 [Deltaproteobacteria bacterium]|nr:hypothetical protein [Deltaproteobacteria bacterium]
MQVGEMVVEDPLFDSRDPQASRPAVSSLLLPLGLFVARYVLGRTGILAGTVYGKSCLRLVPLDKRPFT